MSGRFSVLVRVWLNIVLRPSFRIWQPLANSHDRLRLRIATVRSIVLPNKETTMKILLMLTGALAVLGSAAFAEDNASGDDAALASAKLSITQAMEAVQANTGGTASSVDFEIDDNSGEPLYIVEVRDGDGKERKLSVNASTGAISEATSKER